MVLRFLAAVLFLVPAIAFAGPVTAEDLMRHVEILASDEYEGRAPGTEGEKKAITYIEGQFEKIGLKPAAPGGGWYQPVPLIARKPVGVRTRWAGQEGSLSLDRDDLVLIGRRAEERVERAPVVFAGHGAVMPEHGIDQMAGMRIEGAVVLILYDAPDVEGFPSFAHRMKAVSARGAAAVIGIIGANRPWRAVRELYGAESARREADAPGAIEGLMSQAAAERLIGTSGLTLDRLLNGSSGPAFRAMRLALRADLEVRTRLRAFVSNNVVGRLDGTEETGQSILFLGHWDHLGICRPPSAPDRICNGAVDNASGIAAMIEIARGLAGGRRPKRDILFLATTAEELGLLGAEHFAADPPVPLDSILAAFNLDTTAVGPPGGPVVTVGRGPPELDALIAEAVRAQGRELDDDDEADEYIERQDGWKLRERGVPAMVVGGAFSDMAALGRYLSGPYHQPSDDLRRPIDLGGAAMDSELLIAVARTLGDPELYPTPAAHTRPLARP